MQTSIHSHHAVQSSEPKFRFERASITQFKQGSPLRAVANGAVCGTEASRDQPLRNEGKDLPQTDVSHRFGLRLRELRRERSLTQVRMAADFGIDRSFISDVERGKKSLSLPMLEVIALGMEISLSDLLRDI